MTLIDKLAWNSHEVWAKERRAQGWRYGAKRDMRRKQHPMMLPYNRLSDKDKKWDRTTAEVGVVPSSVLCCAFCAILLLSCCFPMASCTTDGRVYCMLECVHKEPPHSRIKHKHMS